MRIKLFSTVFALALIVGLSSGVSAAAGQPIVGAVTPINALAHVGVVLSSSYSDPQGVATCALYIDNVNKGTMTLTGSITSGTASFYYGFAAAGTYRAQVKCTDTLGNVGLGAATNIRVTVATATISSVSPENAIVNVPKTFSATYTNISVVTSCSLYADGQFVRSMSIQGSTASGTATADHTFTTTGGHLLQVRCTDVSGNVGLGVVTTIFVASTSSTDTMSPSTPTNLRLLSSSANNTALFGWDSSYDNVGVSFYAIAIDNAPYFFAGNNTTYTTGFLTNGLHSIVVRAQDSAGNVSFPASLTFTINAQGSALVAPPPFPLTLETFFADANLLVMSSTGRAELEASTGRTCELDSVAATTRVNAALGSIADNSVRTTVENFTACGTQGSLILGAGERLGVVNSFRAAFGHLPATQADWYDVLKIANGRFPGVTSATAEARAKVSFRAVYQRDPNTSVAADNNAVVVMAYGLRPLPRNFFSEAAAIVTFRAVYGHTPFSATDWDIVRAVAYSGATR